MPVRDIIELNVYDVSGKEIAKLVKQNLNAGVYDVSFDASGLPSGVYFYSLRYSEFVQTRKMLYVK